MAITSTIDLRVSRPIVIGWALHFILILGLSLAFALLFLGPEMTIRYESNGLFLVAGQFFRVFLPILAIICLYALVRLFQLYINAPLMFTVDRKGITRQDNRHIPWADMESIIIFKGIISVVLRQQVGGERFEINPRVLRSVDTQAAIALIRQNAPDHLFEKERRGRG